MKVNVDSSNLSVKSDSVELVENSTEPQSTEPLTATESANNFEGFGTGTQTRRMSFG